MSQPYSFNLVDEPWLPCVRLDGTIAVLSLRDTLTQAHQLQSLTGDSPPQTAALHRFLLAILHRVFGPEDEDAWGELWDAKIFEEERLNAYLGVWKHRFDLFDAERPFYQSATLYLESKWVSSRRLIHDLHGAYYLFRHQEIDGKAYLTPSEASRAVITAQAFGHCGTSGAFRPQQSPGDKKIQEMFVDSSNTRAINFLVQGDSLFETLMLNLVQYPDNSIVIHFDDDAPTWELEDPCSPERPRLLGYLDYLTWQNRRILLRPESGQQGNTVVWEMRWEPATRIGEAPPDSIQHHFKNKKEGFQPLYFSEGKSLWRDSGALFSLHNRDETEPKNRPPATFQWLQNLTDPYEEQLEKHTRYNCLALGMSSKPGQATVYFYREESMPFPLDYFHKPQLVGRLQDVLKDTEEVVRHLRFSLQIMGMYLQVPNADSESWKKLNRNTKKTINEWVTHTGVEHHYWVSLDVPFYELLLALPRADGEVTRIEWRKQLRSTAYSAFEQATQYVGEDGRSLKAIVRGRSYLNYRLNELFPRKEGSE